MTTTGSLFAVQLYSVISTTNRYGSLVVLALGSVGAILNILIFGTDQELKQNPCSRLFLASSIASSIALLSGLSTRFFSSFGLDITVRYDILCKGYMFTLLASFTCSALFTALVSIERWLNSCTNAHYRMYSSMKNVSRAILTVIIVVVLSFAQIFYCFSASLKNSRSPCSTSSPECSYFNDAIHLFLFVIVPCVIMLIFGCLVIRNIRRSLRRIQQGTSTGLAGGGRRTKRTQSMMTALMFTQVTLVTLCNLPAGIQKLYSNITVNVDKSPERRAIEALVFQSVSLLSFVGIGVPFYLYTLTGTIFREAIRRRLRWIVPERSEIHELTETTRPKQIRSMNIN